MFNMECIILGFFIITLDWIILDYFIFYIRSGINHIKKPQKTRKANYLTSVGNDNCFINFFVKTMIIKSNSSGEKTIFKPGSSFFKLTFLFDPIT